MKKPLTLAVLCLTLALGACGKKDDNAVAVQAVAVPVNNPYPIPGGGSSQMTLQQYCSYYGGQMSGSVCSISKNYSFNYYGWGDSTSPVYVYAGERVSVSISGTARILVGGVVQASGSSSFVSQNTGYVAFQKYSSLYSVQSIQVSRCFSAPNQAVSCL